MRRVIPFVIVCGGIMANLTAAGAYLSRGGGGSFVVGSTCPQGAAFQDGCAASVPAAIQFPNVLSTSGYATRPLWNVAGFDFPVGIPTSTVLKDPTSDTLPTGATYNSGTFTVTVSGNNVTLDGYDFSLHNQTLLVVSGTNDIIQNCNFLVGSNSNASTANAITFTNAASNMSLLHNTIDGNGSIYGGVVGSEATVIVNGSGGFHAHYNYFYHSGGDMIDFNASTTPVTDDISFNMWKDIGPITNHQDLMQWYGVTIAAGSQVGFNTAYQTTVQNSTPLGPSGGNGMFSEEAEGNATFGSFDTHNNTIITTASASSGAANSINWALGYYQDTGGTGANISFRHNYVDSTGMVDATNSPWLAEGHHGTLPATFQLPVPMIGTGLINLVSSGGVPVPTFTSQTNFGYWVCPDSNNYCPSTSDIFSITPVPASGNVTTGNTVTLTLAMPVMPAGQGWTVAGVPTISLNDGGTASYISGSGSNSLVFRQTVTGGNSATTLAVTGINLAGGSIKDAYGNAADLTGPLTVFTGLSVNNVSPTLTFTAMTAAQPNSTTPIGGSYTVAAPSGLTSPTYGGGCSGTSTITGFSASGGAWSATASTPTTSCTGTLTVTGVGANTTSATGPSTAFSTLATNVSCTATPSGLTAPVATGTVMNTCTVTPATWSGTVNQSQSTLIVSSQSGNTFNLSVPSPPLAAGTYPSNLVSVSP